MVEATHSDFEIDPATKQREEGEISSQSTQPRYNQGLNALLLRRVL